MRGPRAPHAAALRNIRVVENRFLLYALLLLSRPRPAWSSASCLCLRSTKSRSRILLFVGDECLGVRESKLTTPRPATFIGSPSNG